MESLHGIPSFFNDVPVGFKLIIFSSILLGYILTRPTVHHYCVYLTFPWKWVINFKAPEEDQFPWYRPSSLLKITNHHVQHLGVWKVQRRNNRSNISNTASTILYLHGNGESRAFYWNMEKYTKLLGDPEIREIVAMDYRGFGDSAGVATEEGLYEDATTIFNWMCEELELHDIIIYGHSLGSAVASHLASTVSRSNRRPVAGLILEAPFTSLQTLISDWWHTYLPSSLYPGRYVLQNLDVFPTSEHLHQVECPILILHGAQDKVIPWTHGQTLASSLQRRSSSNMKEAPIVQWNLIPQAGHSNMVQDVDKSYTQALAGFWQLRSGDRHMPLGA